MISIVIPNFNGLEHLKICFESLKRQTYKDFSVILVDNGSTDSSVEYAMGEFPEGKVVELGYNSGFARAVNEGIKLSLKEPDSEFVFLLNNDIELADDFLETVIGAFEKHPEASVIAVKMLNYYNREIIDDCGDFIKSGGGSPLARGNGEKDTGQYDREEFIFGACAGAAIYRSELFSRAGYFDETFFAYYEDIDFSFRLQLLGYKCFYQPKAVCYHKRGGTSSVATHGFQTEMCERNLVLMRLKNYPLSIYLLYQPLFFAARILRYYGFVKHNSFGLMLRALKGYARGMLLLVTKIPQRYGIQKSRVVSASYIKNMFR